MDFKIWQRKKKKKSKASKVADKIELVVDGVQVPREWLKGKKKQKLSEDYVVVKPRQRRRYRIPHLRTIKRIFVAVFLIFNFLSSQMLLFGPGESRFLGLLFLFEAYVCLDYLWQTRYDAEIIRKVLEAEKKATVEQ
ncbi:MAG: hypothetical protein ACUVT9_05365 [Candidatus Bathycorpusculaceae bacterium]